MCRINLYQAVAESTAPWRSSSRSCRRTPWAQNSTSHYVKRQRAWRSLKTYNFRMSRPSGLLPSLLRSSVSHDLFSLHPDTILQLHTSFLDYIGGKTFTVDCQKLADIFIICHLPVNKDTHCFYTGSLSDQVKSGWNPQRTARRQTLGTKGRIIRAGFVFLILVCGAFLSTFTTETMHFKKYFFVKRFSYLVRCPLCQCSLNNIKSCVCRGACSTVTSKSIHCP